MGTCGRPGEEVARAGGRASSPALLLAAVAAPREVGGGERGGGGEDRGGEGRPCRLRAAILTVKNEDEKRTMEFAHRRRPSPESSRRSDRRTERTKMKPSTIQTQRYPRISPTTPELKVIARWSWNRPELRRGTDGAVVLDSRNGSDIRNGLDERTPTIYILLGFKDILIFEINQFLGLK
jgi:hypothetical protein